MHPSAYLHSQPLRLSLLNMTLVGLSERVTSVGVGEAVNSKTEPAGIEPITVNFILKITVPSMTVKPLVEASSQLKVSLPVAARVVLKWVISNPGKPKSLREANWKAVAGH